MKIEGCSRVPHNRSLPLGSPQPPPLSQVITLAHDDHDHAHHDALMIMMIKKMKMKNMWRILGE